MNTVKDVKFKWIGRQYKRLDKRLVDKDYLYYEKCSYQSTLYRIGTGVLLMLNKRLHVGCVQYLYENPNSDDFDKRYRVGVELFYTARELRNKLKGFVELHPDFEIVKRDKAIPHYFPITLLKSSCTIIYGLQNEKPEDLIKEASKTESDLIYACRFIAKKQNGLYILRSAIADQIEITDDENEKNVSIYEITEEDNLRMTIKRTTPADAVASVTGGTQKRSALTDVTSAVVGEFQETLTRSVLKSKDCEAMKSPQREVLIVLDRLKKVNEDCSRSTSEVSTQKSPQILCLESKFKTPNPPSLVLTESSLTRSRKNNTSERINGSVGGKEPDILISGARRLPRPNESPSKRPCQEIDGNGALISPKKQKSGEKLITNESETESNRALMFPKKQTSIEKLVANDSEIDCNEALISPRKQKSRHKLVENESDSSLGVTPIRKAKKKVTSSESDVSISSQSPVRVVETLQRPRRQVRSVYQRNNVTIATPRTRQNPRISYLESDSSPSLVLVKKTVGRMKKKKDLSDSSSNENIVSPEKKTCQRIDNAVKKISDDSSSSDTEDHPAVVQRPRRQVRSIYQRNSTVMTTPTTHQKSRISYAKLDDSSPLKSPKKAMKKIPKNKYESSSESEDSSSSASPVRLRKHTVNQSTEGKKPSQTKRQLARRSRIELSPKAQFVTPKKQMPSPKKALTTPRTSKSKRILLKNLTPSIQERDDSGPVCETPMQKARVELSSLNLPRRLSCRDKEYMEIYNFVAGRIRDQTNGCMYISGVPGTGKTMTVCRVMSDLSDEQDDIPDFKFLQFNALALTEPRQIYVDIVKRLMDKTMRWEPALNLMQSYFKSKKKKPAYVILIDELDKLCNRKQDVVYNMLDLPYHSSTPLILITIANTMDLPERLLTNKVNSRLGLVRLTFKPYQYKDLVKIVSDRLSSQKIFKKEALELIARKVAAVSGDARRALAMCSRATEIAEEQNEDLINMEIIDKVVLEMSSSSSVQAIKACSKLSQYVLRALSNEVQRTGNEEVPFLNMYEHLIKLCYLENWKPPTVELCLRDCLYLGSIRLLITPHGRIDINMTLMLNISSDDIHFALREE